MWPVDSARVAEIASSLDSAGLSDICQRCRLRLAGVKDSREHKRVDTESREKVSQVDQMLEYHTVSLKNDTCK